MIGERIKRARKAAGWTQAEVATRAGLSTMAISKFERDQMTPTSSTLIRLARALGVRTEFFFRPLSVELGELSYRKRASLPQKVLGQIEADVVEQLERFLELLDLYPTPPTTPFEVPGEVAGRIESLSDVEDAALALREAWSLGTNGIPCLADTLEEHGLLVITTSVETSSRFDGLAARAAGWPIVVVGAGWPGDRQRFTLAHELGHLVLDGRVAESVDIEDACNRFAGAFLAPASAVRRELGETRTSIEARELYSLKHEYGLSMKAWVYRAREAGVLSDTKSNALFKLFKNRAWDIEEPGEAYAPEVPILFERLVLHAFAQEMISEGKAAELAGCSQIAFRSRLRFEATSGPGH